MNNIDQQVMKNNMRRDNERNARIEKIRSRCIEANPEIEGKLQAQWGCPVHDLSAFKKLPNCKCARGASRPIRLADVLLAHSQAITPPANADEKAAIQNIVLNIIYWWNLRNDDLIEQSDECITFLADLLQ